jgi:hypothetical protein
MTRRRTKPWLLLWLMLAAIWMGGVAYASLRSWPQVPLDLSRNDPQLKAAYSAAVNRYIGRMAVLALAPPVLLMGFGLAWYRLAGRKQ